MNRDAVVIAGSGMMGSGIAAVSALAGEKTIMLDVDADRAKSGIELAKEHIKERLDNGLTSQQQADCANDLLSYDCNLEEAMARATLVIEAVYEDLGLKQEIFEKIDSMLPKRNTNCFKYVRSANNRDIITYDLYRANPHSTFLVSSPSCAVSRSGYGRQN
jgi:3-hydroxyacyl-CoA dehydrogenase